MSTTQDLPTAFELNGFSIPSVGLGTFQGDDGNDGVKETVLKALQKGYRHIDTAEGDRGSDQGERHSTRGDLCNYEAVGLHLFLTVNS